MHSATPTQDDREKLFYWLKKISSLTAWRNVSIHYRNWADITEKSVRRAEDLGWIEKTGLPRSDYNLILKGLLHCDEGVRRLSEGDKRVFKFDSNGEFAMANRILSHWSQMKTRIEEGENGIDEAHTPYWPDFTAALQRAHMCWQACSFQILEPRYLDEPALTIYNDWTMNYLASLPFPKVLQAVPDPQDNVFVRTNGYTPCSGIWEPIETAAPKRSWLGLLKKDPKPQAPFKIMGAMNYLHGGSRAPKIDVDLEDDEVSLHTTWRLLWRDDRYRDGTIPEEEAEYQFDDIADN
ncbi:Imm71 family immunity protein [Massilia sp. TN1-12]|uniref:Imm71 family immunity protein n=1 Tax=Massilia paldalensis TaxID=3377675 RepID=UPI00384B3F84